MGSGASKTGGKKGDDAIHVAPQSPKRQDTRAYKDSGDEDLDPAAFISPDQEIVHSGEVFKLNYGADKGEESEWLRRRMWLTNTGGLFYYSRQYDEPLGCSIAGLKVRVPETPTLGRYLLEVVSEDMGKDQVLPTVLATKSPEERDAWVKAVRSVQAAEEKDGGTEVDPIESLVGRGHHNTRRRLHVFGESEQGVGDKKVSPRPSNSKGMDVGKMKSFGERMSLSQEGHTIHHRSSLHARGSVRPSCEGAAMMTLMPSTGPSVFRRGKQAQAPVARRNSQIHFASKQHTVLVLDWDDTIFPTTFVRKDCGLDWRYPIDMQVVAGPSRTGLKNRLDTLATKVEAFLNLACSIATVFLVTLAQSPWCSNSAGNFMPKLKEVVQANGIKVIYAREKIPEATKRAYAKNAFKTSEDEADYWMRAKANAMQGIFEQLHADPKMSWKNIISIGDSDFERAGLFATADDYVRKQGEAGAFIKTTGLTSELITKDGHLKRLRAKTVKMLDEPSCEEMIAQVKLLTSWLPHIVKTDEGMDVELSDSIDDDTLNELNEVVTGRKNAGLTWMALADMEGG